MNTEKLEDAIWLLQQENPANICCSVARFHWLNIHPSDLVGWEHPLIRTFINSGEIPVGTRCSPWQAIQFHRAKTEKERRQQPEKWILNYLECTQRERNVLKDIFAYCTLDDTLFHLQFQLKLAGR